MNESNLAFYLGDTVEVSANDSIHHGKKGMIVEIDTPTDIPSRALYTIEFEDGQTRTFTDINLLSAKI